MIPGLKKRTFNFNDLMMVVALARKHLRLVTLLFCLSGTVALGFYVYVRPVYYARSMVRVIRATPLPLDSDNLYHDSSNAALAALLRSPLILTKTAAKLGLPTDIKKITERHLKKITIKTSPDGNLEVEVWTFSLPLAKKWCETMVGEFSAHREEQRLKHRQSIIDSFSQEMGQISQKIEQTSSEKFEHQAKRNVMGATISVNELKNVPVDLVRIKHQITEMERTGAKLNDPQFTPMEKLALIATADKETKLSVGQTIRQDNPEGAKNEETKREDSSIPAVVVLPGVVQGEDGWEPLEKELRRCENEIKQASQIFLPGHPKMRALTKELEKVQASVELEYQVAKNRFDLELQDLKNKEAQLETKLPAYQSALQEASKISQESQLFTSGQLAWNNMYSEMAKQIEKLDWASERERVNLQFMDNIECKDRPVSPVRSKIFLLAILGGLAMGIGIPFLVEFLDHTVSTLEEVESVFQLRGLGIIPQVSSVEQERPVLLENESENRNIIENFRVVRTNLLSVGTLSKDPQVIMVTSSMPKEGKTVVSSNLALSFAQTGAKTLLLDTDMRRGRLHRLFGLRKSPGLSALLYDQCTIEEACRPSGKEGLSILTAGRHIESGTEMLGTPKFAELMAELRRRYDRIIIDTPPVLGLSETSIVQAHADGVLFVVWGGHTPMRNMKVAVETLQANGANFYGFILNRLDLSATINYYQYYYYSNDYYHNYHAIENA
jgi:capsular exopolysaccharide synthesis family protein